MALAPMMQMAMDPRVQKTTKSAIKYLLIFGGVGIAILLFIFMGKKFNPVKKIQDWFKKAFGFGSGGMLGKVGSVFGIGKVGSALGIEKVAGVDVSSIVDVTSSTAVLAASAAQQRRKLKSLSKEAIRKVAAIAKNKSFTPAIRARAAVMKTAFKKVAKKPTKEVVKKFASVFKRKVSKKKKKKKKGWF